MTRIKVTTESFIARAKELHGERYDYSLVEYTGNRYIVHIICAIHGTFQQRPNDHLRPRGCPACGRFSNKELFIEKAKAIHGDLYDYSLVVYTHSKDKVKIVCPIHGIFETNPSTHLQGHQCPHCSAKLNTGWSRTSFISKCEKNNNGFGILYILECFNDTEKFYKIGITSRSVKKRYPNKTSMPYAYTVVKEIVGASDYIYDLEIKLHQLNKENKYIPNISFDGSLTECFKEYKEIN